MRAHESSIFCQMDRCHVVLENRMARSLDSSGKDLVTAMLLSEGAWDVLFSKKLVSLSWIIAGVLTFSDGAACTPFGDGSAAGVSCGACRFASLSDAACSAGGSTLKFASLTIVLSAPWRRAGFSVYCRRRGLSRRQWAGS